MADHIVSAFTDELDKIAADLMRMGGIVETMILDSCTAVDRNDIQLAKEVIARDAGVGATLRDRHQHAAGAPRQAVGRDRTLEAT